MEVECSNCRAFYWMDEKLTRSSFIRPLFGTCCLQGKIMLPALITPPLAIQALYDGNDEQSKSFRRHTREYNAANAFTSLGAKLDGRVLMGGGLHHSLSTVNYVTEQDHCSHKQGMKQFMPSCISMTLILL